MDVISIVTNDSCDPVVAVVKLLEKLDVSFVAEVKSLPAWGNSCDEQLLEAQTFVTWLRGKSYYSDKPLIDCLENETYSWSSCFQVTELNEL